MAKLLTRPRRMIQLAICSVATPTIRDPCVLPEACTWLSHESLVILRPSWRAWFSSCSLATSSARLGSIESTRMLWTRTFYMFSAILHDCPKQAIQDLSYSRATLVRSLVRKRRRSPLGSFLTATTSLLLGRSYCIFCMIASFGKICTFFLSSVSEMRMVSSGPSIEGIGDFGGVGGREVAI
jgi:hypothetical protein